MRERASVEKPAGRHPSVASRRVAPFGGVNVLGLRSRLMPLALDAI